MKFKQMNNYIITTLNQMLINRKNIFKIFDFVDIFIIYKNIFKFNIKAYNVIKHIKLLLLFVVVFTLYKCFVFAFLHYYLLIVFY